ILFYFSFFFFFSSRRRHTRYIGDWSSDVCSSDLLDNHSVRLQGRHHHAAALIRQIRTGKKSTLFLWGYVFGEIETRWLSNHRERSEERRVGKECRSRWSADK